MSVTRYKLLYPAQNAPDLVHHMVEALASGDDIYLDIDDDNGGVHLSVNGGWFHSVEKSLQSKEDES